MYSDILYPTDGSEGAQAALDSVRGLAEMGNTTVHLLYIVDTSQPGLGIAGDPQDQSASGMVGTSEGEAGGMTGIRHRISQVRETAATEGDQILEETAAELEGVDTETSVEGGSPHQAILDYADQNGIDLIVMGTHGRTGLNRYLIGSVTEKVVRLADQPVVTVGPD